MLYSLSNIFLLNMGSGKYDIDIAVIERTSTTLSNQSRNDLLPTTSTTLSVR